MNENQEVVVEYELKEIDTVSTFRIVFFITMAVGVVIAIIQVAVFMASGNWELAGGSLFMLPVIAAIEGALILMLAWLYNMFAARFGGIRVRCRRVEGSTAFPPVHNDGAKTDGLPAGAAPPVSGAALPS